MDRLQNYMQFSEFNGRCRLLNKHAHYQDIKCLVKSMRL